MVPHYVAQCLLAKTMQEIGHEVLMTACSGDFSRCPVMDMEFTPYESSADTKAKLCGDCNGIGAQISQFYGIRRVEIRSFVTSEIRSRISETMRTAPGDLRDFVFDGVFFGKVAVGDLVLATKCSNFDNLEEQFRTVWLRYIENSMLAYLTVQTICRSFGVTRILYFNEYSLNRGGRLGGRKLGIPVFSVTQASHVNVDRRRFIVVPEILPRARDRVIESWRNWRELTLSSKQLSEVGDDILVRLGGHGSHVYSPGKTVRQMELFERIHLSRDRKLIAAFTSSLDEWLAGEMLFEGMGETRLKMQSPFADQLDWLQQLTAFVETSENFQLIVRVHPREGANKRENVISQHLLRLKAAFDRKMVHCRFIWPEDKLSSYDLVEIADLVLTSWTTVGFEAARVGVPVLKAFGNYAYPDDDFLVWASTVGEYFRQVIRLCASQSSEESLLHAFRCHYALRLASSFDLGDIIPTPEFQGVAPFRMPSEAASIEEVIVSGKSPSEINFARMANEQSPRRSIEEKEELRRQLFRIIHFLHTGEDREVDAIGIRISDSADSLADPENALPSPDDEPWITVTGNETRYCFGGQTYSRYSPLAARLANLCRSSATSESGSAGMTGRRPRHRPSDCDPAAAINEARSLFKSGSIFAAFDIYEQLADENPDLSVPVLAEAFGLYTQLGEANRYDLYQGRVFDFGIQPGERVLDIGSGHLPFPFATHLGDIALEDGRYGRAGIPFKHVKGKPVYECDVEKMHFKDKEFDFVYCSHVLEHAVHPEKACQEIMRVARRGYIETPTRGKDLWLNTAKVSNHRWSVELIHETLVFTEYSSEEIDGLRNDILMQMHCSPQTDREKAFSALVYLKPERINTMLFWEGSFDYEVRRLSDRHGKSRSAAACGTAASSSPASVNDCGKPPPERLSKVQGSSSGLSAKRTLSSAVFLNTYYPAFLEDHYRNHPGLADGSYQEQLESLVSRCFGDSDFYSLGFRQAGWTAKDLIVNCQPLQHAWANENGVPVGGLEVAIAQIKRIGPDVVYIQDLSLATTPFLSAIRPHAKLIVGQIACPVPEQADLSGLDIVFSSFPHFVDRFRSRGVTAYYMPLAFDQRVLDKLPAQSRRFPVTFVGGLSAAHMKGRQFLEEVAGLAPVEFWGYGVETLPESSVVRSRHHGELWGLDMFALLSQSRFTLNRHIDVAENNANNMRLFEATGCGALLFTDYKDNLNDLFNVGGEVVAYRSADECAALINYYLAHRDEAEAIAVAGQERTLRDHTYEKRMEQIATVLDRHLRHNREGQCYGPVDLSRISYGHTPISADKVTGELTTAWKSPQIPARQRALVQQELDEMFKGKAPAVFGVLSDALHPITRRGASVLEIGCSSGYYYEALEYLLNRPIDYIGVDYSEAMIAMAEDLYPKAKFKVADGARLPFGDSEFEVAISSCILLHVPNYPEHISETARVARNFVVAHRTPICRQRLTQCLTKYAYGVLTVELRFNEKEILSHFVASGLDLVRTIEYHSQPDSDEFDVTYVFSKKKGATNRVASVLPAGRGEEHLVEKSTGSEPVQAIPAAATLNAEELRKAAGEILRLCTETGIDTVRNCLDELLVSEGLTNAAERLVVDFMKQPTGAEAVLQGKLEFASSRGQDNIRFYLKPQLEKFFLWLLESNETTNYTYDLDPLNKEYLACTISIATGKPVAGIEGYIDEISNDNELREHIRGCIRKSPLRVVCDLNVQFGRRIGWYAFVRVLKPKVVIETGVEKGMGSCVIARALMRNEEEGYSGVVYGTDIDSNAGFLVTGLYAKYAKIWYGDSIESLKRFSEPIDLFINDSAHSQEYERQEYLTVKDKLTSRAVILGDDSHNSNELRRFARITNREFLFFAEKPLAHWYQGAGIGIGFKRL